jgi:hypothetical protein
MKGGDKLKYQELVLGTLVLRLIFPTHYDRNDILNVIARSFPKALGGVTGRESKEVKGSV